MTTPPERMAERTEDAVCWILKAGVSSSLAFIVAGSLLSFLRGFYGSQPAEAARLSGPGGAFPRTAAWFLDGLAHGNGQAVIVAGLLLLIATPILRVAVSLYSFARERERDYVLITALVLILLLLSFALGKTG